MADYRKRMHATLPSIEAFEYSGHMHACDILAGVRQAATHPVQVGLIHNVTDYFVGFWPVMSGHNAAFQTARTVYAHVLNSIKWHAALGVSHPYVD